MITEFAQIEVTAGMEQTFIAGVKKSLPLFLAAKGCKGMTLQRSIEAPMQFLLIVQWESVEDHMVHFRQSENYQLWRGNVGPCFAAPPVVWHGDTVV